MTEVLQLCLYALLQVYQLSRHFCRLLKDFGQNLSPHGLFRRPETGVQLDRLVVQEVQSLNDFFRRFVEFAIEESSLVLGIVEMFAFSVCSLLPLGIHLFDRLSFFENTQALAKLHYLFF